MARKKSKPGGQDVDLTTQPGTAKPAGPGDPAGPPPDGLPGPAPQAPAPAASPDFDLALAPAGPPPEPLEERIRRLEEAVDQLGQLQALEQRVADRVATQLRREPPAPAPAPAPSVLASAAALVDAGRQLLPSAEPPPRPGPHGGWLWLLREALTELQATFYMYVDPRYRLSWIGRVVPPVLLVLFVFSSWWLGTLLVKPVELLLCYGLFKVVGVEARRYRETAPDLPPHLRA